MSGKKSKRLQDKIIATSTPNTNNERILDYSGKKLSPILRQQSKEISDDNSSSKEYYNNDAEEEDETLSSSGIATYTPIRHSQTIKNKPVSSQSSVNFYVVCTVTTVLIILLGMLVMPNEIKINSITILEVREKFPSQSEDVWDAISSGVNEVKSFNKPSVFLFLYDNEASRTLDSLIDSISKYASGILNEDYNTRPIVLNSSTLNTVEAKSDFGYVISKYKPELEKRSVMIVKNLDQIPGEVAQAFHSMCDEISPLVGKTMYMFTIQVKNETTERTVYETVEDILRKSWQGLDDDIFYPLFTRITSIVLRIEPENLI